MLMKFSAVCVLASAALLAAQEASAPAAQQQPPQQQEQPKKRIPIPDKFTNLKVLPQDITKPQLMAIMKGFSKTMNVRCSYCHSVADDLSSGDFVSDDKAPKAAARQLLTDVLAVKASGSAEEKK
jgi:hypothetical protein